jgi:hypothetical protein
MIKYQLKNILKIIKIINLFIIALKSQTVIKVIKIEANTVVYIKQSKISQLTEYNETLQINKNKILNQMVHFLLHNKIITNKSKQHY